jgi:hypothetical protein
MITIEEITPDGRNKQTWRFTMFDLNVVFVEYKYEAKPHRKRKWNIVHKWDKYAREHENSITEPELEPGIIELAKIKVTNRIKVMTWDEWKR